MSVITTRGTGAGQRSWPAILFSLFLLASSAHAADTPPLVLEHLTTADGLPQATVTTTLQDSEGFVWFGTEDGLVRYDGRELVRYAYSRSERNSLSGNFIWKIVEDAKHDLWIAVKDAGVARWQRSSDSFTVWRHDPKDPASLASDGVRTVLVDTRGHVWIGTSDAGVDVLDPVTGRIEHLTQSSSALSDNQVFALSQDRAGTIWAGTSTGLDRWNAERRAFEPFGPSRGAPGSLQGVQVSSVLPAQNSVIWAGTFENGLVQFDAQGQLVRAFRTDPRREDSLASNDVRALLEDQEGRFWVGTGQGLDLLDRATGLFNHYRSDASDTGSLRDSFVMSLYQDGAGLMWIGTRAGGVSRWNPESWKFGGQRPSWLRGPVTSFADAPDNHAWISSLGGGITRFDADTGAATPVSALLRNRNALDNLRVMLLRQGRNSSLWIGTVDDGLKEVTREGDVRTYPVKPGDARSLSAAGPMSMVESRTGQLWLGTYGGGVNILDPTTGVVRQLPYGSATGEVSAHTITALLEDQHGNIWIGTESGGLNLARPDGRVFAVFRSNSTSADAFPANTVYALAQDSTGTVWAGTDGAGLVRVLGSSNDPGAMRFEVFDRTRGLSSDAIYGVVPDATGGIWLSGNSGLMRLDTARGTVKTYHREHGLHGEEFAYGAYHRLRDGRLAFGGPTGFNIFDPARIGSNREPPRLALTGIEVLGVRATGPVPFWLRDRIDLDHRGSIVSLDFGVLEFTSPKHNRLAYRMSGLTDQWIDLGPQRRITLTNLDAGDHTLEVRAANSDSVWSVTPLKLSIHRDPAPWLSPWAYAAYIALALAFILRRMHKQRLRIRRIEEARERLDAEVKLRTSELRESNRQLAEAAAAKSSFLDRMSHELRTPMNGVVGMTELLTRTSLSATQSHLTKTIRSSAQILLQIVNDLLDLSKIRAGKVTLEALPIELGQVLEECTSLFAGAAENKGIELIVCPPERIDFQLLGDPLRVRQILMNLVGNAVKFTTQGEVVVRADVQAAEAGTCRVRLSVTDTGIGMDAEAIGKIFEPFAQADETTTRKFGGTGLGLAICRELADIMGGRITVESQPQIGSTFTLSLMLKTGAVTGQAPVAVTGQAAVAAISGRVRIASRRPSLAEALTRHTTSLGLTPLGADAAGVEDILLVDAATQADLLKSRLAAGRTKQPALIVVASAAEAESLGLRVLLDEKMIVLKPVHRIALHEALARATGIEISSAAQPPATELPELRGHILLAEDEAVNAAVAQGYLEALGCTSVRVKNGEEAVARSAVERFDLVLMDLNMPGMDGFATTTFIRQRERQQGAAHRLPIVALTAHDAVNYRERVLKADMDDILSKPYALEDCTRLLRRWLVNPGPSERIATPSVVSAKTGDAVVAVERSATNAVTTADAALDVIDNNAVEGLRRLRAGKQGDLYPRLVELFRPTCAASLSQLRDALAKSDLRVAAGICHKLASSAANVGALAYARTVRQLEQTCIAGDLPRARALNDTLQSAHAPLMAALDQFCLRATA